MITPSPKWMITPGPKWMITPGPEWMITPGPKLIILELNAFLKVINGHKHKAQSVSWLQNLLTGKHFSQSTKHKDFVTIRAP